MRPGARRATRSVSERKTRPPCAATTSLEPWGFPPTGDGELGRLERPNPGGMKPRRPLPQPAKASMALRYAERAREAARASHLVYGGDGGVGPDAARTHIIARARSLA